MKLSDMKLSKSEQKRHGGEVSLASDSGPEYPYGLRLDLEDDALRKLGIKTLPKVGSKMRLEAQVTVVATGTNSREDQESRRVELQIEKLGLTSQARSMEEAVRDGIDKAGR